MNYDSLIGYHVNFTFRIILILGFTLYYKKLHGDWQSVDLDSHNRSYIVENLSCGTQYSFHMRAYNRIGEGLPSHTVTAKTNGAGMVIYLFMQLN